MEVFYQPISFSTRMASRDKPHQACGSGFELAGADPMRQGTAQGPVLGKDGARGSIPRTSTIFTRFLEKLTAQIQCVVRHFVESS